MIAAGVMAVTLAAVVLFREPILRILGGSRGTEAATVLIVVSAAQAINGAVFWNTGLLLAAGRAGIVTLVALFGIALQVSLLVPLVVLYDANGAAGALLATYAATNVVTTVLAIQALTRLRPAEPDRGSAEAVTPTASR